MNRHSPDSGSLEARIAHSGVGATANRGLRVRQSVIATSWPTDARWNGDRQAVEFGAGIGEYEGVVRVPRRVFQRLVDGAVTPERCVEAFHLQRTRFEMIAERKLRNRQLADNGNVDINGRDLRQHSQRR